MVTKEKKRAVWFLFVPVAVTIVCAAFYIQLNVRPFLTSDYVMFLVLAILVGLFPVKTEDAILFLVNGISLPVLVIFGLVPEIIVSSIALVVLMMRSKIRADQHYRYALNLLMFYFLSVVSATFYYLTLRLSEQVFNIAFGVLALTVYLIAHLLFNQATLYLIDRFYYEKASVSLFDDYFKFLFYTNLFVAPLSFVLIYLYEMTGTIGIVIGALPFIAVTIGTNFYFKSKVHNKYLKLMNRFSQDLHAKKTRESIIETFIQALVEIFPADALSYFTVYNEEELQREKIVQDNRIVEKEMDFFKLSEQSILKKALVNDQIVSHNHAKDWKKYCINELAYDAESAIVIPVKVLEQTEGVILLTHKTRSMYDELIVSLVEVFHKYLTIALDNAYHYEQLEETAEKDYLTGLPNLKGLSKHLQALKEEAIINQMSLIVLDLDHFKKVNDTHGHQAGNEILKRLAKRLKKNLRSNSYVARYGGEEFIILLPDYSKEEAFETAERIRLLIADKPFRVSKSIKTNAMEKVSVTASIGIATCTDRCGDIEELIHLADRAMYIGSKQKGRNRVTVAQKEVKP